MTILNTQSKVLKTLIVIPLFNHGATVARVVQDVFEVLSACPNINNAEDNNPNNREFKPFYRDVLVVDDGSTDNGLLSLEPLGVEFIRHEKNMGKGVAIRSAAKVAAERGYTHIITIDADRQHYATDIPLFLQAIATDSQSIFVGKRDFKAENVPFSSKFGRSFSGFWMRVQTGCAVGDMQSGFRAYPLAILQGLHFVEARYSFEIEVLVKASWAGFDIKNIDIQVYYPKPEERVSHFRAFKDNLEISILNTKLTMWAMMPIPHKQYQLESTEQKISGIHPIRSLRTLLLGKATPKELAYSAFIGMFFATLPLIGLHSISVILFCSYLKLNRIWGLAISQFGMPPFVPALCIELGYYLRNGEFLTELSWQTLGHQALERVGDWVLGSLILAPVLGVLFAALTFFGALSIRYVLANANKLAKDSSHD